MANPSVILTPENFRIHVVHYSPFEKRRAHMEKILRETGLDQFPVNWMLDHDREALLDSFNRGDYGDPSCIAAASVSLIMKHLAVYQIVAGEPDCWHLILEDDLMVTPNLIKQIQNCLSALPKDWELFFIGEGCGLHVPWWRRRPGKRVYFRGWKPWWRAGGGTSRCTEAYFVSSPFAKRFLASRHGHPPFSRAIDWLLAEAGYELHIRSYWAEPPLITQGAFASWTKDPSINELLGAKTA